MKTIKLKQFEESNKMSDVNINDGEFFQNI